MPSKSQWDFGDLFGQPPRETKPAAKSKKKAAAVVVPSPSVEPSGQEAGLPAPFIAEKPMLPLVPPPRRVLSVSELTWEVKRLLERQVGRVWVEGEITNLRLQGSGHAYFTLKDVGSQVSCVLFRGERVGAGRDALADGRKVLLEGELTVYEARGQYQLRVSAIELQGQGALQAAFERLKKQLQAEGLFAPERKRSIPRFPRRIGLVTSPTGAAIRDVLHVLQRRGAAFEIILAPSRVQGDGAAGEIASAIRQLNRWSAEHAPVDVILITRGGGSLEDLWAFNEEAVARAVFESVVPVVSAVGHEIDFSIADFVADLRAATPSAAAELLSEGYFGSRETVSDLSNRLGLLARRGVSNRLDDLAQLFARLIRVHPRRKLDEKLQRLDDATDALARCVRTRFRELDLHARTLTERFGRVRPEQWLKDRRDRLQRATETLRRIAVQTLRRRRDAFVAAETRLRLLSPGAVLHRGYSITFDAATGRLIRSVMEAPAGTRLKTRLADGDVTSRAEEREMERHA
jgi:exodeoxyribonuclease VII large subunit